MNQNEILEKKQSNILLIYEMQCFVYLLINECAYEYVCASVCVYVNTYDVYAYFSFIYSFILHIAGYLWNKELNVCSDANVG